MIQCVQQKQNVHHEVALSDMYLSVHHIMSERCQIHVPLNIAIVAVFAFLVFRVLLAGPVVCEYVSVFGQKNEREPTEVTDVCQ